MRFRLEVAQGRAAPRILEVDAPTLEEAQRFAARQGYSVLSGRATQIGSFLPRRPSANRFDVPVFVGQLRDLLTAGLSVIEALTTLQRGARDPVPVLDALVGDLRAGRRLSETLASQPVFPPLLVALVRAAELTSDLPQALGRYLDHEQKVAELRHRITSVAIYPVLVTGVGGLVLLFLLLYVMPRFARVFEGMSGELPWSARFMVWWAQWLGGNGLWMLGLAGAVAIAGVALVVSPTGRRRLAAWLFGHQAISDRLRIYFLARWYRATGLLVEGGIPLAEALRQSNDLLPEGMRGGGRAVEQAIHDGHAPAAAHARAGMVTPVAEQLMRAGERTGELGGVLVRIAQFHEAEVARSLERGMRALEPVVMVLIGLGVGLVVVLMYLPIFELAASIQ
jgi:general secretion pathway protein F